MSKLIIIMGVCGTGKTTVGTHLANSLGLEFKDGDDLHSPSNRQKMDEGTPLTDADRQPWLASICDFANEHLTPRRLAGSDRNEANPVAAGRPLLIACSALKKNYRDTLRAGVNYPVDFLFLHGAPDVIANRLQARKNHYMKPGMLASQLETLEDPTGEDGVIRIEIAQSLLKMLAAAEKCFG